MKQKPEAVEDLGSKRRVYFIRELVGFALGMGAALIFSSVVPAIREQYTLVQVIFWGAVAGGILVNLGRFEQAGAALTRKQSRPLNFLVGFGIPLGLVILFLYLGR